MDITELDISEFLESEEQVERSKEIIKENEAFMATVGQLDLEVYRMEKFKPTLQPKETWGKFYEGDSYVVVRQNEDKYELHYWHGKDCTSDEMGTSAAWTTQLSEVLSKDANHNLEEQNHEGDVFMSYFQKNGGLAYLPGGIESGFRDVTGEKEFVPRLLCSRGDRYARVFELDMKAHSINEGDVFILDMNTKLYFWPGKDCNVREKVKALETADAIRRTERHTHAEIIYPREDEALDAEFWELLGGKPDEIPAAHTHEGEEACDEEQALLCKLWKISNDTGKLACTEITETPLHRDMLDTNDVFILELNKMVNIWIGKEANVEEKKNALVIGKSFVKKHNKPKGTRVVRTVEDAEDVHFKSFFEGFYKMATSHEHSAACKQDIEKLANKKRENVEALMTKLGANVTVKVYLCENGQPRLLDESDHGHFFQGSVYAIDVKGDDHRYLIQWFGPRLPGDEVSEYREYLAILTDHVFEPALVSRVSVMQGHEDDTLLTFFKSGFICHDGPYEPIADRIENLKSRGAMYKIQGPFGEKPQAIQQDSIQAANLNSNEAWFVSAGEGDQCFAWAGQGASEEEIAFANTLGPILCPGDEFTCFRESEEPESFWTALGGKTEYSSIKNMGIVVGFEPRLYQLSNASGYFLMKEVPNYSQSDLNIHDIMVLDAFSTVFMWIGTKACPIELKNSYKKIDEYIKNKTDGRGDCQVVQIEPAQEPINFRTHFPEWEDEISARWFELDEYEAEMARIKQEKHDAAHEKWGNKEEKVYEEAKDGDFHDYKVLVESTPEGVDPTAKENYLNDKQFEEVFKVTKDKFKELKEWKKKQLKKDAKLF